MHRVTSFLSLPGKGRISPLLLPTFTSAYNSPSPFSLPLSPLPFSFTVLSSFTSFQRHFASSLSDPTNDLESASVSASPPYSPPPSLSSPSPSPSPSSPSSDSLQPSFPPLSPRAQKTFLRRKHKEFLESSNSTSPSSPSPSLPPLVGANGSRHSIKFIRGTPVDFSSPLVVSKSIPLVESQWRNHENDGDFLAPPNTLRYHEIDEKLQNDPKYQLEMVRKRLKSLEKPFGNMKKSMKMKTRSAVVTDVDKPIQFFPYENRSESSSSPFRFQLNIPRPDESFYFKVRHVHPHLLFQALLSFERLVNKLNLQINSIGSLPKKIKKYTFLRSPHVDKTARDQLEIRTLTRICKINVGENIPNMSKNSLMGPKEFAEKLKMNPNDHSQSPFITEDKEAVRIRILQTIRKLMDRVHDVCVGTLRYQYQIPANTPFLSTAFIEETQMFELDEEDEKWTVSPFTHLTRELNRMREERDNPKETLRGRLTPQLLEKWQTEMTNPSQMDWRALEEGDLEAMAENNELRAQSYKAKQEKQQKLKEHLESPETKRAEMEYEIMDQFDQKERSQYIKQKIQNILNEQQGINQEMKEPMSPDEIFQKVFPFYDKMDEEELDKYKKEFASGLLSKEEFLSIEDDIEEEKEIFLDFKTQLKKLAEKSREAEIRQYKLHKSQPKAKTQMNTEMETEAGASEEKVGAMDEDKDHDREDGEREGQGEEDGESDKLSKEPNDNEISSLDSDSLSLSHPNENGNGNKK